MKKNLLSKKVAILLSGGVDSSVAALLLRQNGFEVVGITGKMLDDENFQDVCQKAKKVADKLGIEHFVIDLQKDFQNNVVDYFEKSYRKCQTPNPCVACNKFIKWGKIFDYAISKLNCDFIATGHYAKIEEINGFATLMMSCDTKKDQLYYLYQLDQEHLKKTIFPLANLTKSQVKQIAIENDLPSKSAKESQDICFIKKPFNARSFLEAKIGKKNGDFILAKTGEKIGQHNGAHFFTIGQRKGIAIAYKVALYVVRLDVEKNIVFLGEKEELFESSLTLKNVSFQNPSFEREFFNAYVKIRYNMPYINATIDYKREDKSAKVIFEKPVNAITKGQSCVFYDQNQHFLIGGGVIA